MNFLKKEGSSCPVWLQKILSADLVIEPLIYEAL
jgi:hypothetical protein